MLPKNKYRGKMNKVLLEYVKEMEMDLRHAKKERVFITHSGCDAETIQQIYDYLKNLKYFYRKLLSQELAVLFLVIVVLEHWGCYLLMDMQNKSDEIEEIFYIL